MSPDPDTKHQGGEAGEAGAVPRAASGHKVTTAQNAARARGFKEKNRELYRKVLSKKESDYIRLCYYHLSL